MSRIFFQNTSSRGLVGHDISNYDDDNDDGDDDDDDDDDDDEGIQQ